ncbi:MULTISPECIES: RrF2 family transcriptional regulator [unclassified Butyrivibrio]|uniref:RrF2 family transcriptional regulator n=1 Tax=unclassified Butyrivibrio TaxID=2639466 RepID=UPI0003FC70B0|nr:MULTISPECIES: Rrf2 family transcriptional regulator [unclassified Butyrivibrio]
MKISTKGRYALRVLIDLALHNTGEYISLKDISARQNLTVKYLEQIVSPLGKAGFLQSMRGNNGGHRLAKAPSEICIGDVLRIMEGDLAPIGCIQGEEVLCPKVNECPTIEFWVGLDRVVNDYVNSYTLQDLVKQTADLAKNA